MLKVNTNSRGGTIIIFYLFWLYINLYSSLTFLYFFSTSQKKYNLEREMKKKTNFLTHLLFFFLFYSKTKKTKINVKYFL